MVRIGRVEVRKVTESRKEKVEERKCAKVGKERSGNLVFDTNTPKLIARC